MITNGENDNENSELESEEPSRNSLHEVSLSLDIVLSSLAHHQRRDLLHYLIQASDQTRSIDTCVDYLMKQEVKRTGERSKRDMVKATLHHVHIPMLADAGILEYDSRSQEIRYWSNGHLEAWLARIHAHDSKSSSSSEP